LASFLSLILFNIHAQSSIDKNKFNSSKEIEDQIGYTQAVKVGNTIYISGIAARGPMDEAVKRIYNRAEKILANYQATLKNVVKETAYTTQIDELIKFQEARKQFYNNDYPTSTWVEIKRLYVPDAILEIDFIAEVKE
jgi:enamine deaminase RidA (YjgF/YER057c/UK114 family)